MSMKRYTENFVQQIRELRKKESLSLAEIGRKFNIPSSTIRNWCYGIEVERGFALIKTNEYKRNEIRNSESEAVIEIDQLNQKQSMFVTSMLYGCEGAKYPSSNRIEFVNSNPDLILTFLKLLQKSFKLKNDKFTVHLQIHSTHDFTVLRRFWSEFLDIPESYFIKPTVTKPNGKKHRKNYMGTCSLRYRDYKLQLKLIGIFDAFIRQFTNDAV